MVELKQREAYLWDWFAAALARRGIGGAEIQVRALPPLPVGPDRSRPDEGALINSMVPFAVHVRLPELPRRWEEQLADELAAEIGEDPDLRRRLEGSVGDLRPDFDDSEQRGVLTFQVVVSD